MMTMEEYLHSFAEIWDYYIMKCDDTWDLHKIDKKYEVLINVNKDLIDFCVLSFSEPHEKISGNFKYSIGRVEDLMLYIEKVIQ